MSSPMPLVMKCSKEGCENLYTTSWADLLCPDHREEKKEK